MKNPPRFRTHLEGWRPTVALAGHIVVATFAGLRLVGGTVRSSHDASEHLVRQIVVSTCLLLDGCNFRDFGEQSGLPDGAVNAHAMAVRAVIRDETRAIGKCTLSVARAG